MNVNIFVAFNHQPPSTKHQVDKSISKAFFLFLVETHILCVFLLLFPECCDFSSIFYIPISFDCDSVNLPGKYDCHCPREPSAPFIFMFVVWIFMYCGFPICCVLCAENLILNFMIDINIMMVMMMVELTGFIFIVIFNAFSSVYVVQCFFYRTRIRFVCHGNRRLNLCNDEKRKKKWNQNHWINDY